VAVEVWEHRIKVICHERTAGARLGVVADAEADAEHQVVDEQLRAPNEELGERPSTLLGLEAVLLLDPDPRQLEAQPREIVATTEVLPFSRARSSVRAVSHSSRVPVL
jgi:hypothetical protein